MSIRCESFGQLPSGEVVNRYTLTNHAGAHVSILNYGGIIQSLFVPDRNGQLGDVVLGCSCLADYLPNKGNLGALIGRVGNRIGGAAFDLNGVTYHLYPNDHGNCLHGGQYGFNTKMWRATPIENGDEDMLVLTYESADGEENFPGALQVIVTYTFTDANELKIRYEAVSTKDTLCNLTNHSYFNLRGEGTGTVLDTEIQLLADAFTPTDEKLIPTGEIRSVEGTLFDLRQPRPISTCVEHMAEDPQLMAGQGYDHNFVINGTGMRKFAEAYDPTSGRVMTCHTDMNCTQFYTGNMLGGMTGKCGREYGLREGFCLETQFAPDSIHHPNFPDSVLRAGEKYDYTTIFAFSAR